jgi:hypothetical protein
LDKQFDELVFSGQSLLLISESDCAIHQPGSVPVLISGCLKKKRGKIKAGWLDFPRILQKLKLPANDIPTKEGVMECVILPPKFLIGNKTEMIICFDLFDETKMRKTKWFCNQMKITCLEGLNRLCPCCLLIQH